MKVRDLDRVDLSRLEERSTRGWLGRWTREDLSEHGAFTRQRDEPTDAEEREAER